ncbi:MAG: V-type ATPase subunit [Treponema sp.]|jgi:vacuolar-type H+-ATPase subunit C/Vma6|nr:V-type ATPase subunit [Treponema sp.]
MPGAGERAYAYAKACGIIGKSFIGRRMAGLGAVSRLSELDRLVFPGSSRDLPEKELLSDLEDRLINRAAKSIIAIVDCFSSPPEFLSLLVRSYEYSDLKSTLTASAAGETKRPAFTDIGRFNRVKFEKWPDIAAMIRGSEFEFLLDKNGNLKTETGGISLQTQLDRHYYAGLWKSLVSLPKKDKQAAELILADEISLRNSSWVLRLRSYYRKPSEEVKSHLLDIQAGKKRSLAQDAYDCLELPLETRAGWSSWRWAQFLNPERGGQWQVDPRYFQNAASAYLYRLARKHFRVHPFSLDTVFCFIKLKQFEEDILTSDAEGLGMGMSSRDVFGLLEVEG